MDEPTPDDDDWDDWPQEPPTLYVDFDPADAEPWQILGPDGDVLVNVWRRIGFARALDPPTP